MFTVRVKGLGPVCFSAVFFHEFVLDTLLVRLFPHKASVELPTLNPKPLDQPEALNP